ncbi:glycoside hydrolase family 57 [Dissulfurimicrobium hydrothermale]|uniref:glycoside hydrolase family 57 n=1 Tax=Dissulfurimicrobium hydrothermale TaxID=1750598 RepID=UPI001EDA90E0|nr:glycoside hydrolase family 57 [Dissulfurimicrobium hydrothermale]UKL12901.1 glycoside hydrolase family 57 [Dissulfurimicrobium hydrothermale]
MFIQENQSPDMIVEPLYLFSFFHLNLAFSSIEEEQRPEVINRCYWPLLRLVREQRLPMGIEVSGYTLETIKTLDPAWIEELRRLCREGLTEFIGSGYVQIIGPLVPAAVNRANQRIGLQVYEGILGLRPQLALVNEQAYSAGIVSIYKETGYQAIIMEWDNPASSHPEWNPEWRYLPQLACGSEGTTLPVIWNKSIAFQKFQRYAHGEIELPEYIEFLNQKRGVGERTLAIYGNDAEIFDFRPGRFHAEAVMGDESEWTRISRLFEAIKTDGGFTMIRPSQVIDFLGHPGAGHRLRLESAEQPVPVKKQAKYNLMRWALAGRDSLGLNTSCWRLFEALAACSDPTESDWKELCYLWSSDFRTHITAKRWQGVQQRLAAMQQRLLPTVPKEVVVHHNPASQNAFRVRLEGAFLEIETMCQRLRLNLHRGLAVNGWWDKTISDKPLIRTLPHGYFDDIHYGADFYTGHFVLELPGQPKLTDLSAVDPHWEITNGQLVVHAEITTSLGPVCKEITINADQPKLGIAYHFYWPRCPNGTLRLGHITLNPELFARDSLFFSTHNGGDATETFFIHDKPINHLAPVSALVSASHGLGVTSGIVIVGDATHRLIVEVDKTASAVTGHILYAPVDDHYLYRLIFSAMEMDDTSCHVQTRSCFKNREVSLCLRSSGSMTTNSRS